MARYMAGHPGDALEPLQKSVRLQPALAPASLFLGASLLDLGRARESIAPLQRAVTAMPQNPDAREMLSRAYLDTSDFRKAASSFGTLTTIQPGNPKGWYGLARSYERIAEEALASLEQEAPDSPLIELVVADVAVTQEKFPAALAIYRRVLEGTPPVGGLHQAVAALYVRAGKPEWAAQELRRVTPRRPSECAARVAECEFLAGKFREALTAAMQSATPSGRYWTIRAANRLATESVAKLETLPPSVELHLIRAELAQSAGRNTEAVTEVRAALQLSPGNPAIESALAEALLRAHNLDEALPMLERDRPTDESLLFMYGDALLEGQQVDRAIPILERTVAAKDAPLASHAALGRAYVQAGRYEDALPHLNAAAKDDENGEIALQLARVFQALGRSAEAQKAMAEYQKRRQRTALSGNVERTLTPPK
ncbi:MAG: tetratricopeptide repeat protein [Acidobacteria bacterium]|nr:tetratricopeptide repeat protein [Acidobacteriota bacterium]